MKKIITIILILVAFKSYSQNLITSKMDGVISVVNDTISFNVSSDTLIFYNDFVDFFENYTEGKSVTKFYYQDSSMAGNTCQRLILVTSDLRYRVGIYTMSIGVSAILSDIDRIKFLNFKTEIE